MSPSIMEILEAMQRELLIHLLGTGLGGQDVETAVNQGGARLIPPLSSRA